MLYYNCNDRTKKTFTAERMKRELGCDIFLLYQDTIELTDTKAHLSFFAVSVINSIYVNIYYFYTTNYEYIDKHFLNPMILDLSKINDNMHKIIRFALLSNDNQEMFDNLIALENL